MQSNPQLERQWLILRALCARRYGVTLKELADEAGVHTKTIRRDLKVLKNVGFPLEEIEQDHGRKAWRIHPDRGIPELSFTFEEAISLYMGRRFLDPLAGTHFWQSANSAFRKIRAMFDETALNYLNTMAAKVYFPTVGASDYSKKAEILDELSIAIEDRHPVFLEYHSSSATEPYGLEVYPLGLVYHKGSLYLVAHSTEHGEIRHFKLDRVHGVETKIKLQFQLPYEFDLNKHMAPTFRIILDSIIADG